LYTINNIVDIYNNTNIIDHVRFLLENSISRDINNDAYKFTFLVQYN